MAGDYGDLMAKLVEAFEGEAEERLQELNKATLALEQASDPAEVADLIKLIFREAHTLKGTAGGLGLKSIERVGHSMETVFGLLRAGELTTSPDMFDAIYKSLDAIGELAKTAARSQPDSVDIAPLVDALNEIANRAGKPAPESQSNATSAKPAEPEVAEVQPQAPEPVLESSATAQAPDKGTESLPKKRKSRPPATVPTPPVRAVEPAPTAPAPTAPEPVVEPAPAIERPVVAEKSAVPRLLVPKKSTETISKPVQTQPKASALTAPRQSLPLKKFSNGSARCARLSGLTHSAIGRPQKSTSCNLSRRQPANFCDREQRPPARFTPCCLCRSCTRRSRLRIDCRSA